MTTFEDHRVLAKLAAKQATVAVIGLGTVGLSLACPVVRA
jgi:UDP-N-acetyl-D-mannosaminuronate dehydrogenase